MRTEVDTVKRYPNGKWSVSFNTFAGKAGAEYLANSCESGTVFATEDDAWAGANRAMDHLEKTGRWPNMCEVF